MKILLPFLSHLAHLIVLGNDVKLFVIFPLISLFLIKLTAKSKNQEEGETIMTFDFRTVWGITPELLQNQSENESCTAKTYVKMHQSHC